MTINDMSVLLAAIDLAVKRGAYSVLEIQQVGAVAEKLNAFVAAAREQVEAAQQAEEQQAAESPAEEPVQQGA